MEFLMLLGRLAQYFPNTLKEKASRMINQLLYEMEKEVTQFLPFFHDTTIISLSPFES